MFIKIFFKWAIPGLLSLFSFFQYTVDSKQMFYINKFLPMTGFEPRTSGMEATALPTEPQPLPSLKFFDATTPNLSALWVKNVIKFLDSTTVVCLSFEGCLH